MSGQVSRIIRVVEMRVDTQVSPGIRNNERDDVRSKAVHVSALCDRVK